VAIAERFRAVREAKNLSAEEVERRAGLERWVVAVIPIFNSR